MDKGRPVAFGANINPSASQLSQSRDIARIADQSGLEYVGIQDHPYQRRFLDAWTLIAALAETTDRVSLFPNVANLPLRPPAMLANAAASADILSGGRIELGLGAGSFWVAIAAMGGPVRNPGEAVRATEEAIDVMRLVWSDDRSVRYAGEFYSLEGYKPGPHPMHAIGIWLGVGGPRMLDLLGRKADGWSISRGRASADELALSQSRIDAAASRAGRDPSAIRRLYNLNGLITDRATDSVDVGPVEHWVGELTGYVIDGGFDTFLFWPSEDEVRQVELFATEVAPRVREAVAAARA